MDAHGLAGSRQRHEPQDDPEQLHKRLQEEADVIIEAYNAAGGQAGGQKYYEGLYRSGVDELKSYVGYKYEGNSGEGDD